MEKKQYATISLILAPFAIACALIVIGAMQPNVCWRCLRPMTLEFQETSERHDGSQADFRRWRCPGCKRTRETTKDELW